MAGSKVKKDNTEIITVEKKAIKKSWSKYNLPNYEPPEDADKVRQVLAENLRWYDIGNKRVTTLEDIETRTRDFFQECVDNGERPTVEKYCLALGHPRSTVNDWKNGVKSNDGRADILKKAFDFIAAYDASRVTMGELNPVTWIFRAKNYYGMKDQQELVLEPKNPLGDNVDAEQIAEKYAELPEN